MGAGQIQQGLFTGTGKFRGVQGLHGHGVLVAVLHHGHPSQQVRMPYLQLCGRGQVRHKDLHAVRMVGPGSLQLAQADDTHLGQAALHGAAETGVRLDPVDQQHMVGPGRVLALVQLGPVRQAGRAPNGHVRADGHAHGCLREPEVGQYLQLTGDSAAAMAAHGRKQIGPGPAFPYALDGGAGQDRQIGQAAAAAADGHRLARLERIQQTGSLQGDAHGTGNVRDGIVGKVLIPGHQAVGQCGVEAKVFHALQKFRNQGCTACKSKLPWGRPAKLPAAPFGHPRRNCCRPGLGSPL